MDAPVSSTRPGIWPVLWRERYIILASIVVMLGLAVAYTLSSAKVYEATAIIEVNVSTANPGSTDTTNANQGLAQNYATLLVSSGFLQQIQGRVDGGRLSADELQSRLSTTALPQSALVQLHATGPSPAQAQQVAQQVVTAFLAQLRASAASRTAALQSQLQAQIAVLTARITALEGSGGQPEQVRALVASRQALINQIGTLVANGLSQGTSASLSAPPAASSSPVSPKKSLNLIAGLLLGVLLGVTVAWLRQSIRPAIRSANDVTSAIDLRLLSAIPLRSPYQEEDSAVREAYGVLYANLAPALRAGEPKVVAVVGHNPGVGKSSVVQGLAQAAARTERNVLMVDGDMRAATLSTRFGAQNKPGLADVLQGVISPDPAIVNVADRLSLLPTRPTLFSAASLLSGARTNFILSELRSRYDLIVVDSPPLSGLADGLLIAEQSDFVILVARTGVTRLDDLTETLNSLIQNSAPVAGVVVFQEMATEAYYGSTRPRRRPRLRALAS